MTSGRSLVGARRGAGFAALGLTLLLVGTLPVLGATARQATPDTGPSDPCAAIVAAAGTPAADAGGGMGALDPIPGQQTGELGNPADYPFDLVFLDAMIRHHEGATLLAEIALIRAGHEELRGLAQAISEAQAAEVAEMSAWRTAWYPDADPVPANVLVGLIDEGLMQLGSPADMGNGMGGGPVAGAAEDALALCTSGGAFDLTFIDLMIPHHQRAIGLALLAQQRAEHPELRTLAEAIIAGQEAEIAQMTAWRDEWAAAAGTPAASAEYVR
jgi:uncharacterized protein (DUF305 family)